MKNVEMKIYGKTLIISVDMTKEFGPMEGTFGMKTLVATTGGGQEVSGTDVSINLTVSKPNQASPVYQEHLALEKQNGKTIVVEKETGKIIGRQG